MLRTSDLTSHETKCISNLAQSIRLSTANGIITSSDGVYFTIPELGVDDEAHVCESAPEGLGVLSLGKLVRIGGRKLYWDRDGCFFTTPDGMWRQLEIEDDVSIVSYKIMVSEATKCYVDNV